MNNDFIPFALPDIGEEEEIAVLKVLRSGWITTGSQTKEFEEKFKNYVSAKHAIAVNSATAAMHLALEAIGLQKDDEVIVPTYTFAATAEVVRYFGAKPVLVDVDAETLNLQPATIEQACTERTKAVIPVHIAGLPAQIYEINEVAKRLGIYVIEDAAHAFPCKVGTCKVDTKYIGSISDFTCFSFYATKTITTGEGGMICTNNDEFAERCRIMSLHGISKDAWNRYSKSGSWKYDILAPGYKYNLTDIAAALGLVQLQKAQEMRDKRENIAQTYSNAFKEFPQLVTPTVGSELNIHAWHLYMLRIKPELLEIDRDGFIEELKSAGIGASVHFIPLHLHSYYKDNYGYVPEDFPSAYNEYSREISLPIYSSMSMQQIGRIVDTIRDLTIKFSIKD